MIQRWLLFLIMDLRTPFEELLVENNKCYLNITNGFVIFVLIYEIVTWEWEELWWWPLVWVPKQKMTMIFLCCRWQFELKFWKLKFTNFLLQMKVFIPRTLCRHTPKKVFSNPLSEYDVCDQDIWGKQTSDNPFQYYKIKFHVGSTYGQQLLTNV